MRVALVHFHVGGPAGGGGAVRQMLELGRELQALGHHVTVCCHDYEPGSAGELEVRAVRSGTPDLARGRLRWLRRQWRGMAAVRRLIPADAEIVNAHGWPALHAVWGSPAPLVWSRNDETVFERAVTPASAIAPRHRPWLRALDLAAGLPDLAAARRAAEIVALDEHNAAMVRRAFGRRPRIARSGPAERFFEPPPRAQARARLGIDPDEFLVLGVGVLMAHRRFEDLIAAVDGLEGVRALIVSSAHMDPAYAARLPRSPRVRIELGGLDEEGLRAAYAAADVFVFASRRQAWGLAPLEALASGTPVIISSGVGVSEVLAGRPGVTVVEPLRPSAIAAAIQEVRRNRPDPSSTRAWIRSELSNRRYAEDMLEIYESARS